MSDRPRNTTDNSPEDRETSWQVPQMPGGWRVPNAEEAAGWRAPAAAPAADPAAGWRVPALPPNLAVVPEDKGEWHLPRPEDTTFRADDEIEITDPPPDNGAGETLAPETEEAILIEDEGSPDEIEALEADMEDEDDGALALPFDDVPRGAGSGIATAEAQATEESPLPFDGHTPSTSLAPGLAYSDDDDDESFSMSELVALASLVEEQPTAAPAPADAEPTAEAPPADPNDPAEYARQQLARLSAEQSAAPAIPSPEAEPAAEPETAPAPSAPAADDPAEYARRQLERLSGNTPSAPAAPAIPAAPAVPAAPAPALDPKVAALAQKYRDTEDKVKLARRRFQSGQITRDQLQAELRGLMVLDDNQVWWMMGVETDTWYQYENGGWVVATPPALAAAGGSSGLASGIVEPPVGLHGTQVSVPFGDTNASVPQPYDGGQTVPTSPITDDDDYMPLPRAVPVRDPDFTMPGTGGIYLPPTQTDMGMTQPMGSQPTVPMAPITGATIPSAPVQQAAYGGYVGVPAPGSVEDPTAPPSYDLGREAPVYQDVVKRKRQSTARTLLIVAIVGLGLLFLMSACGIGVGLAYYSSLASPYQDQIAALANYQPQFQTARILDAQGNQIVELTSQDGGARQKIALRDMSPFFIHAIVATENERFFDDPGWDAIAIGRAIIQNATSGDIQSGASTITQQIARMLILHDTTVSAERKLQEIVIASEIAQRYDKNFILELYLNEVFLGNRSYGVEAAAQAYFDKSAADLGLAESALIAGLIQAPATYDPVVNPQAAFERMDIVLERMRRVGCLQFQHEPYLGEPFCITDAQVRLGSDGTIAGGTVLIDRALVQTTSFSAREYRMQYPHFVNFVQAQIEQSFGSDEMYRRGFTIRTTLIPAMQDAAQTALSQQIAATANTGLDSGAVLVVDPTSGAIRAMVGSPDFNNEAIDGQVNNVLTWHQPGSSIKPIVYLAGMEGVNRNGTLQYLTPASVFWDVPTTYNTQPVYQPVNYDRLFHGPVALRYALQNSYNIPVIKALEFVGIDKYREVATRLGLRFADDAQFGLPSALGSNEVRLYDHIQAYAALANGGQHMPLFAVTSITDADGNQVELPARPQPTQAISPQLAFLMANILSDNEARSAAFGLNSGLTVPGWEGAVGAKTGTTNDNRDLWTMGFTRSMVVGVWTGRVDNAATSATTSTAAIPIWNAVMRAALQGASPQPFADPGGIIQVQICGDTGTAFDPNQTCSSARTELFAQDAPPPPATSAFVQTAAIDTWTGFRANQYCSENVETRTFVNITDPSAVQWLASAEGATFAQALGLPEQVEALPAQECSPNTQLPNIRINAPTDGSQVQGIVQVTGSVTAPNFNRYQLEVASLNNPDAWTIVHGPLTTQQNPGSVIGQWDTTQTPNGLYKLRLAAFANDGGFVYRTVQLGVNNPLPTPIPLPTAAPTQFVVPTFDFAATPLPFDPQVAPTGQLPPTLEVPGL